MRTNYDSDRPARGAANGWILLSLFLFLLSAACDAAGTFEPILDSDPDGNEPPEASFSESCEGLTCTFDASTSTDPDGSIGTYAWDFGDGATETGSTAEHTYASGGTFEVALVVTDDAGETGADTIDISVEPASTDGPAEARSPGTVTDLSVDATTETSATLSFEQVSDGAMGPASYDIRYAPSPIGYDWGGATPVSAGSCASPLEGTGAGATLECTVEGLSSGTSYDFQVVAFRGTLGEDAEFGDLSNVATGSTKAVTDPDDSDDGSGGDGGDDGSGGSDDSGGDGQTPAVDECGSPDAAWIWCDDFEQNRLGAYFEYQDHGGDFARSGSVGVSGSTGMRARFNAGDVSAGSLKLAFGRTPASYFESAAGSGDYREIYWRVFVRYQPGWIGGGGAKMSRATSIVESNWAQSMIAHVWSGSSSSSDRDYLFADPASGTDTSGNIITTTYNDFDNLRWLGADRGDLPLFDSNHVGEWYCVEARARLNDSGASNGEFQVWIDGTLDAQRTGMNWVGSYDDYGINAVFLENYWNSGAPADQERYFDNFVVSTERIGCGDA